jgi:putative FmdB family regulatory protein
MLKSYDTECKECGQIVEQFLEDEESLNPCPICGNDMRRIFTTMNFKLIYDPKTQMCG